MLNHFTQNFDLTHINRVKGGGFFESTIVLKLNINKTCSYHLPFLTVLPWNTYVFPMKSKSLQQMAFADHVC